MKRGSPGFDPQSGLFFLFLQNFVCDKNERSVTPVLVILLTSVHNMLDVCQGEVICKTNPITHSTWYVRRIKMQSILRISIEM